MLVGLLQKAYFAALPDAAIRSFADVVDKKFVAFTPEQKIRLSKGLDALRVSQEKASLPQTSALPGTKDSLIAGAASARRQVPQQRRPRCRGAPAPAPLR